MLKGGFIEIFSSIIMIEPDADQGASRGVGDGAKGFDVVFAIAG